MNKHAYYLPQNCKDPIMPNNIKLLTSFVLILLCLTLSEAMSMSVLAGKKVLVTGGGRGIGRAIAHILAREGASVAICSRTKSELDETVSTFVPNENIDSSECSAGAGSFATYFADVKDNSQVENMVSSIVEKWGGIDILINNAGRGHRKAKVHELKSNELQDLLDLNVVSTHTVTSAVLNQSMMEQKSGRIINISSKAGKVGIGSMSFYVASKFALEGYSAALAEEMKEHNIIVNTISPGMVDTVSFPKAPGRKGVRSAESIRDGLLLLLQTDLTGHYVHVDELDQVRDKGLDDSLALKPINEAAFQV